MTELKTNRDNLENLSDEQLIHIARRGDNYALEALMSRYKNLVYAKSKPYFLAGAEKEDIIQEGFIGLYKAVRDFNEDKLPRFAPFASMCVTRRIITAVKAAARKKHQPLNSYIPLDKSTYDDDASMALADAAELNAFRDPESIMLDRERADGMENKISKTLSKLETEVLLCYLDGMSYREIAARLARDEKSVDNAMQRAKKKLETALEESR